MKRTLSRRTFIGGGVTTGAGLSLGLPATSGAERIATAATPAPPWPVWDAREESALLAVLKSGNWGRTARGARRVLEFEAAFAERMGARYCVATSSGTTALLASLGALNLGPGDEVILPPYTFVATFNAITAYFALPVFVDTDAATFQIDATKIAAAITPRTKLLLPVHIGGSAADLDAITQVAGTHRIPFVEDACQAWLGEWRGKPLGTAGIAGCFSFQASKHITAGEGGAVVTNDEKFAHQVYNFHAPGGAKPVASSGRGANFRLTEFQAGILLAQLARLEQHARVRDENAAYLSELLRTIPGIAPAGLTPGCTRSAYHMYMMRYDRRHFADLPRARFLRALGEEGVRAGGGYSPLNTSAHVRAIASHPHYLRIYGPEAMAGWAERNQCPVNNRLCQEAFVLPHTQMLGRRSEMEQIAEAILRVQKRAAEIARA